MSDDLRATDGSPSAVEVVRANMIKILASQDLFSLACQAEFARFGPDGMLGFWAYEMRRRELMQLFRKPRGRQPSYEVTTALKLENEGQSRKDIYVFLGKTTRLEQHALSEAMRQRKFRQKRAQGSL